MTQVGYHVTPIPTNTTGNYMYINIHIS